MEKLGDMIEQYHTLAEKIFGKDSLEKSQQKHDELLKAVGCREDESLGDAILRVVKERDFYRDKLESSIIGKTK